MAGVSVRVPRSLGFEQAKHEAIARTTKVVDGVPVVSIVTKTRVTKSAYVFEVAM